MLEKMFIHYKIPNKYDSDIFESSVLVVRFKNNEQLMNLIFVFKPGEANNQIKKRRMPHYVFDRFHGHINTHRFSTHCSLSYFVLRFVDIVFAYCFSVVIFVFFFNIVKK